MSFVFACSGHIRVIQSNFASSNQLPPVTIQFTSKAFCGNQPITYLSFPVSPTITFDSATQTIAIEVPGFVQSSGVAYYAIFDTVSEE
jgi:hypothetical protein